MRGGVRARLEGGAQLLGTFVQIADPAACEVMAKLGFEVLCVEAEHSCLGVETVQRLVLAMASTPAAALVRVAGNDPIAIAAALDAGAEGVLVPRVSTAAEAEAAVAAARFPPVGSRGLGPSRATAYGADIAGHLARANRELLLAVQVETAQALENLHELLAVAEIDLVFVGPGDLACSLGIQDPAAAELADTVASILTRARAAGRLTGVFAGSPADAARWRARGAGLVILGSDLTWLTRGAAAALAAAAAD